MRRSSAQVYGEVRKLLKCEKLPGYSLLTPTQIGEVADLCYKMGYTDGYEDGENTEQRYPRGEGS